MTEAIPRLFHRIWFDQDVAECPFNRFWERFAELHPGWELRTWNDSSEVRAMIEHPGVARIWDEFIETDPYGRIPDIARYVILERFGGFYVDTDVEPLRAWDELVADGRPTIGWEDDKEASTSVLISPARHPAIRCLLEELPDWQQAQHRRPATRNPVAETGPRYATAKWRHRDDVRRLPPIAFFPVHWKQMPDLHPPYPERSFGVHHWASGWKSAKEKEHVQSTSIVGSLDDAARAHFACYMPEAQLVEALDEAECEYVCELKASFLDVAAIRGATRRIKDDLRPVRFESKLVSIYRRDLREAEIRPL